MIPQYLLTAYMLLVSVAGPSVCCCSFGRVFGLASKLSQNSKAEFTQAHRCCAGKIKDGTTGGKSDVPTSDGVSSEKTGSDHCQCERIACSAVPKPTADAVAKLHRYGLWSTQVLSLPILVPSILEAGTATGQFLFVGAPVVPSSGRELRIELHSWRC